MARSRNLADASNLSPLELFVGRNERPESSEGALLTTREFESGAILWQSAFEWPYLLLDGCFQARDPFRKMWTGRPRTEVAMHPQTLFDLVELTRLRAARASTHAALAANLRTYLDLHRGSVLNGPNVGGYAVMARIWEDRPADIATAVNSLINHCDPAKNWDDPNSPLDLRLSANLGSAAIAYDVLFDQLDQAQRALCQEKIAASAEALAVAVDQGFWWKDDLVNNHNWVNFGALGLASQALESEHVNATRWRQLTETNFQRVKAVQDLVSDGSWHEGIGYLEFGLVGCMSHWIGAARRGGSADKTALLAALGRYILSAQLPNQPRVHIMTHGDWNWSRPPLIAALRWAARRFQDPYAQEAARRWDLEPRLFRQEFGPSYALEYIAYDPNVPLPDMAMVPLDLYNSDQQSVIFRSGWGTGTQPPDSDVIVLGFKAGVFGGRGNYSRMATCDPPAGILNYGHDHEDDLGLWIYGKGGWLLPEAVAYNCCDDTTSQFHSTSWHNTFLIDKQGQLGDTKTAPPVQTGTRCASGRPAWFFQREASMPLHLSSDHYAFARGDGARLYPIELGVSTLLRTVTLSRDRGGFVALHDRVRTDADRSIEQLFHSMTPATTSVGQAPWVRLENLENTVLGIRVVAPADYAAFLQVQVSNEYRENMDDDGHFGLVRVSPRLPVQETVFLEVMWPMNASDWNNRPNVQPLDPANPEYGFQLTLEEGTQRWIYAGSDATAAGGIRLDDGAEVGIVCTDAGNELERVVLLGSGALRDDQRGMLLSTPTFGLVEVSFTRARADVSGTVVEGVRFLGPQVTDVRSGGTPVQWTREGPWVILGGPTGLVSDIVGFGSAGMYVALSNGDGTFSDVGRVLDNYCYDAGGWRVDRHPRFLADLTGDGRADIVGFGSAGVYVALSNGDGTFSDVGRVLDNYCYDAGGWRVDRHPRFLADLTGDGRS